MSEYWIYLNCGEFFRTGKVIEFIGDANAFVKFDTNIGPPIIELVSRERLTNEDCFYFTSEEDLKNWLEWLETPDNGKPRPRIVSIKGGGD